MSGGLHDFASQVFTASRNVDDLHMKFRSLVLAPVWIAVLLIHSCCRTLIVRFIETDSAECFAYSALREVRVRNRAYRSKDDSTKQEETLELHHE